MRCAIKDVFGNCQTLMNMRHIMKDVLKAYNAVVFYAFKHMDGPVVPAEGCAEKTNGGTAAPRRTILRPW